MTPFTSLRRAARPVLVAVALVATAVPFLGSASAAAPTPASTNATITWNGPVIRVKVTSPKPACETGRRTFIGFVFGDEGYGAWGDTNDAGVYRFPGAGYPDRDGKLLAYVGRTPACRVGQSNVLTVEETPLRRGRAVARTSTRLTRTDFGFRVKVDSPRAACEKARKVDVFYWGGDGYASVTSGFTDNKGVWRYEPEAIPPTVAGLSDARLTAFVRRSAGCATGQSAAVRLN